MNETDPRLLLLHDDDNVLIAREGIVVGTPLLIASELLTLPASVERGHKLARHPISIGEKILKYGAPIGSATAPIARGCHVHVQNIRSDYTATHLIDKEASNGG